MSKKKEKFPMLFVLNENKINLVEQKKITFKKKKKSGK
jgi:hypothetical protein